MTDKLELIGYKITPPDNDNSFLLAGANRDVWEELGFKCEPIYMIREKTE